MELRKKRYKAECKHCRSIRKMEVVGNSEDQEHVWLRCNSCHMAYLFPLNWFDNGSVVQAPQHFEVGISCDNDYPEVVEYSTDKTFALGQRIYHKRFDDTGQVVSKTKLDRGSKIVVAFSKYGQKTLIEGLKP